MADTRWPAERATAWHEGRGWVCGFNYVASTSVNSTEMWQSESFDPETMDRELGWAGTLGLRGCRVFLQYLVWEAEGEQFLDNLERFLDLAGRRGCRVMPVLFDDCAFSGKQPYLGPQDAPVPGIHNSGWTPSPGFARADDPAAWPRLEGYVRAVLERFGDDPRVSAWDLYNEPGNSNRGDRSLPLLEAVFRWARQADPGQPLTAGTWNAGLPTLSRVSASLSDVVSFHSYHEVDAVVRTVDELRECEPGRPVLCTEWMARTLNSRFSTHLPFFRNAGIDCYSWGLVRGKSQTHYPWGSPEGAADPDPWFHDVLHPDGTPYCAEEAELLLLNGNGEPR